MERFWPSALTWGGAARRAKSRSSCSTLWITPPFETKLLKDSLYILRWGLYHTLGYEREIQSLLVAPGWFMAKGDFLRKDDSLGPGC